MTEPGASAPGPVVAFDTSGDVASVAVGRGSDVLSVVLVEARLEQAARLVPAIERALGDAGIGPRALAGIVVGEGPGSFTGVRVAGATAKGLAHALERPLWAIPSLTAAALAHDVGPIRYVLFDARGDRVYGGCYGVGAAGVEELVPPHGGTLREALAGDVPAGAVFVGEGAARHRAAIEGAGFPVGPPTPEASLAEGLLSYLALHPRELPVALLSSWEPRYVRASSAQRAWTA